MWDLLYCGLYISDWTAKCFPGKESSSGGGCAVALSCLMFLGSFSALLSVSACSLSVSAIHCSQSLASTLLLISISQVTARYCHSEKWQLAIVTQLSDSLVLTLKQVAYWYCHSVKWQLAIVTVKWQLCIVTQLSDSLLLSLSQVTAYSTVT